MEKLIKGLNAFRSNYFNQHWQLFEQLAHGQKPRVLFITCSDSRIDPNLITQTGVGELFVIRNAGNIIPPYGAANGGEGATLEYAIQALGIEQIVVCGHSHCGAMKGLLHLNKLQEDLPLVYDWLRHTEATRRLLKENYAEVDDEELLEIAIAENVLTQIENLETYPIVHSRLYQHKLSIYGWIYHLETGEVLAYDAETRRYMPPQSQLEYEEEELRQGEFSRTHAPPVFCGLPQRADQPPDQPATIPQNGKRGGSLPAAHKAPTKAAVPQTFAPDSWLSPEQADRIFRGRAN